MNLKPALYYSEKLGFSVIPAKRDKKAMVPWAEFQHKKPTKEQITEWWTKWPEANIAIVTGEVSGIDVVDVDNQEGWDAIHDMMPDSIEIPTVKTPKGWHLYFRHTPGLSNGVRCINGCDFRTTGGYVIAPPSRNGSDKAYVWTDGSKITDVAPPALPDLVLSVLQQSSVGLAYHSGNIGSLDNSMFLSSSYTRGLNRVSREGDSLVPLGPTTTGQHDDNMVGTNDNIDNISNGRLISFKEPGRDDTLFHLANHLVRGNMPEANIRKYLHFIAKHCTPPYSDKECEIKIKSALDRARRSAIGLTDEIRDIIANTSGNITTTYVQQLTTMTTRDQQKKVAVILGRMVKEGILEKTKRCGEFRIIESDCQLMDLSGPLQAAHEIRFPFGLEDLCVLLPKSIAVIAGEQNAGKTAWLLNVAMMNMHRGIDVDYYSSEMGPHEMRLRLEGFNMPVSDWNVKFFERSGAFHDVINPNAISIIDYMEVTDSFWLIADNLKKIYDKLDKGVAIIGVQKDAKKEVGRGGSFSMEKPRIYLTLESDPPQGNILTIKKGKIHAVKGRNPNGMRTHFKIRNGCELVQLGGWEKPSYGKGQQNGADRRDGD